jgi:hypothetical protein
LATRVNKIEEIELQDGTKLVIGPLNIKRLRRFMEIVKGFEKVEDETDGLDVMVDACQIALEKPLGDKASDRDYLEDNLDMPLIERVLAVCGGVDISGGGDPNPPTTG